MVERMGKLNPPPVRQPIPIMIGGTGEKVTLRITAQYAHIWNGFGDPAEAGRLSGVLDQRCSEVGRDPSEIERSITLGGPEQIAMADQYVEQGITHLIVGTGGPEYDFGPLRELIQWRDSRGTDTPAPASPAPQPEEIASS